MVRYRSEQKAGGLEQFLATSATISERINGWPVAGSIRMQVGHILSKKEDTNSA